MDYLEKLKQGRELILQAESMMITKKGFCPYEIGFCLRSLEEAINQIESDAF